MSYNWNYTYVGGVPRVRIATGEDIAHLDELNEKMWTVLSCPVKGLQIDEKSLDYIDTDRDAQVHVTEVVSTAKWLCRVLNDPNLLIESTDTVELKAINTNTEDGDQVLKAAQQVLKALGKADSTTISLADSSSCLATVMQNKVDALRTEREAQTEVAAPYADSTEAVAQAYAALDAKVRDWFLRSRLAIFSSEGSAALDVQVARIEAISAENLTERTADIASYPLFRITEGCQAIPLNGAKVNPAWAAQWEVVRPFFNADVTEAAWSEMGAKLEAYRAYRASLEVTEADIVVDDETASIQLVDKFLHLTRDFYTLLKNFVTLTDFYNPEVKAMFQAGTLYIDQRACHLCLRVTDPAAMAAQASASGLYLVFCHCQSKVKSETMDIVAAVTVGDVSNISVGKNAIFYDRQGHDWDARVTNIIDNPISIRQAALSPYRKFASFVEEKIRSMAQSKEDAVISKAASTVDEKAETAATNLGNAAQSDARAGAQAGKDTIKAFDIAKFAGIFAAIGMAVGFIGQACVAVAKGFTSLTWWQQPLTLLAIFLLISGPSMFLAWLKLRKRNLAPVLNANGWAINAAAMISISFGNALTDIARFPLSAKMRKQDPFADKEIPLWKKLLGWFLIVLILVVVLWFFRVFTVPGIESPYSPEALTAAPDTTAVAQP